MKQECWPEFMEMYLNFLPKYKTCKYHDLRYKFTKERTYENRAKIDRIFLAQMLIEKPNNKLTAYIYYILVRLFWWYIFYK